MPSRSRATQPVGTGRLLPDGHIGRMAVLKDWRRPRRRRAHAAGADRAGEGARRPRIVLSAQVHAVPFYRAHGFVAEGDEYMEAGIRHQEMRRTL